MTAPTTHRGIRFRIEPGDVPAYAAARRLGLSEVEFEAVRERLHRRGFPHADPDTGLYDLDAIDAWRKLRNPQLFGQVLQPTALNASDVVRQRIEARRRGVD